MLDHQCPDMAGASELRLFERCVSATIKFDLLAGRQPTYAAVQFALVANAPDPNGSAILPQKERTWSPDVSAWIWSTHEIVFVELRKHPRPWPTLQNEPKLTVGRGARAIDMRMREQVEEQAEEFANGWRALTDAEARRTYKLLQRAGRKYGANLGALAGLEPS